MKQTANGFTVVELMIGVITIGIIGSLGFATLTSQQQSRRNDERRRHIIALQQSIEDHYAQNGKYPTLNEINNASWRVKNLKKVSDNTLRDPKGSTSTLTTAPQAQAYSYDVKASDDTACDNSVKDCVKYKLTATYEGGDTFEKTNLN